MVSDPCGSGPHYGSTLWPLKAGILHTVYEPPRGYLPWPQHADPPPYDQK